MERRGELSTFVHPTASPRVGYFYMDLCLVHGIQLCYNKSEIRAALRAMCEAATFRTHCRSETDENPIRAAKCCFEPRRTRLPDARISKPHPRKGTETSPNLIVHETIKRYFKTTSPQGDGNASFFRVDEMTLSMISKPHPRKGTETHPFLKTNNSFDGILKPHPRKGTETTILPVETCGSSLFQNHIPVRGRNTRTPSLPRAPRGRGTACGGRGAMNDNGFPS